MNTKVFDDSNSEHCNKIVFNNLDENLRLYSHMPQTWLRVTKLMLLWTEVLEIKGKLI